MTGLQNGVSYRYRVRAVNAAGASVESNEGHAVPQPVTTPEQLRAPQISSGYGSVIVQWLPPRWDGGTPVLHYEYCLEPIFRCDNLWVEIRDSAPGGANHGRYEITRANGAYTIVYLRAVNAQGAGPPRQPAGNGAQRRSSSADEPEGGSDLRGARGDFVARARSTRRGDHHGLRARALARRRDLGP